MIQTGKQFNADKMTKREHDKQKQEKPHENRVGD